VELLVALPVLAVVAALAVAVLLAAHRQARASDGRQGNVRELRHGGIVLAAELRPLRPADLIAWSDTSIEFHSLVGVGIACDTRAARHSVDLLPAAGVDAARTAWSTPPEAHDDMALWLAPRTTADSATPWTAAVQSVGSSGACERSPLRLEPGRAIRLTLRESLPAILQDGAPVRVTRRVRYTLYRAADGLWYLGRRTFDGSAWDVAQPVVGPLLSASRSGVAFVVTDSLSAPLASGDAHAAAVQVRFRAARAGASPATVDSSFTSIALRGRP
jgi:hypothetical protein